jgi:hypothetical protein
MVSGDYRPSTPVSTPVPAQKRIAELNQSLVDALRQSMTAQKSEAEAIAAKSKKGLVDIGTGSMATNEFCDLNQLVAKGDTEQAGGFGFICP